MPSNQLTIQKSYWEPVLDEKNSLIKHLMDENMKLKGFIRNRVANVTDGIGREAAMFLHDLSCEYRDNDAKP